MPVSVMLFCPFNVVQHGHENNPCIERCWTSPVQILLNMRLDGNGGGIWCCVPTDLHFWGCQIHVEGKSMFLPHVLQLSLVNHFLDPNFGTSTCHAESENTRSFILLNVAAKSLSNVILDHSMCSGPARFARLRLCDHRNSHNCE